MSQIQRLKIMHFKHCIFLRGIYCRKLFSQKYAIWHNFRIPHAPYQPQGQGQGQSQGQGKGQGQLGLGLGWDQGQDQGQGQGQGAWGILKLFLHFFWCKITLSDENSFSVVFHMNIWEKSITYLMKTSAFCGEKC